LVTLPEVKDTSVIIKDLGKLLKVLMFWLMKHAIPKQVKTKYCGEDEDYPSTSNQTNSK